MCLRLKHARVAAPQRRMATNRVEELESRQRQDVWKPHEYCMLPKAGVPHLQTGGEKKKTCPLLKKTFIFRFFFFQLPFLVFVSVS